MKTSHSRYNRSTSSGWTTKSAIAIHPSVINIGKAIPGTASTVGKTIGRGLLDALWWTVSRGTPGGGRVFSFPKGLLVWGVGAPSVYSLYKYSPHIWAATANPETSFAPTSEMFNILKNYPKYREAFKELYPLLSPLGGAALGGLSGMALAELLSDKDTQFSPAAGFLLGSVLGGGLGYALRSA